MPDHELALLLKDHPQKDVFLAILPDARRESIEAKLKLDLQVEEIRNQKGNPNTVSVNLVQLANRSGEDFIGELNFLLQAGIVVPRINLFGQTSPNKKFQYDDTDKKDLEQILATFKNQKEQLDNLLDNEAEKAKLENQGLRESRARQVLATLILRIETDLSGMS